MGNQVPQQGLHGKENCTEMRVTKVQNPQPIYTHSSSETGHTMLLAVLTGGVSSCNNISYVATSVGTILSKGWMLTIP